MRRLTRQELIAAGYHVARELVADGLKPTLRQLYYRLVAAALIQNSQREYKRLGAALTAARKAGDFPLDWIEDRTRDPKPTSEYINTDIGAAASQAASDLAQAPTRLLWAARWHGQVVVPSVWVEKEALASVFERACNRFGVGLFVCRGYPSLTALVQWLEAFEDTDADEVVIQYYGDHDPDGLKIPETSFATLEEMAELRGSRLFCEVDVRLERVALTRSQIREVKAPPFHAKLTSTRYDEYVQNTGTRLAWELDALPPRYLDQLIQREIEGVFDSDIWHEHRESVLAARAEMVKLIKSGSVSRDALARMG